MADIKTCGRMKRQQETAWNLLGRKWMGPQPSLTELSCCFVCCFGYDMEKLNSCQKGYILVELIKC